MQTPQQILHGIITSNLANSNRSGSVIRALNPIESFYMSPFGSHVKSVSDGVVGLFKTGREVVYTAIDLSGSIGTMIRRNTLDSSATYEPISSIGKSIDQNGFVTATEHGLGNFVHGMLAPLDAINRGDTHALAGMIPGLLLGGAASRLGGISNDAVRDLVVANNEPVWMHSSTIRQTQKSVSYAKRDELGNVKYTLDDIFRGFSENPSDPRLMIDAVKMRDGLLSSVDNSRPAVLNATGGGQIQVRVRAFDDSLTADEMRRFRVKSGDEVRTPSTWGEAAEARIWKQGDEFMRLYPQGAPVVPKISGAPEGSIWSQFSQFPWKR